MDNLKSVVEAHQITEVIFCSKDVSHSEIMKWMTDLGHKVSTKIIPQEGSGIIGSRYRNRRGELYAIDAHYEISRPEKIRQKRLFDILWSVTGLILIPFYLKKNYLKNIGSVLIGNQTWVGYGSNNENGLLPHIRKGVYKISENNSERDYFYARDYTVWTDIEFLVQRIFGNQR